MCSALGQPAVNHWLQWKHYYNIDLTACNVYWINMGNNLEHLTWAFGLNFISWLQKVKMVVVSTIIIKCLRSARTHQFTVPLYVKRFSSYAACDAHDNIINSSGNIPTIFRAILFLHGIYDVLSEKKVCYIFFLLRNLVVYCQKCKIFIILERYSNI